LKIQIPKNTIQKIFTIIGIVMFFFGIWQMDMICVGPVWANSWTSPKGGFSNAPFEFGMIPGVVRFDTTIGAAYDLSQIFMVLGLVIAVLSLWFWDE
jgi:hypothetical protein